MITVSLWRGSHWVRHLRFRSRESLDNFRTYILPKWGREYHITINH